MCCGECQLASLLDNPTTTPQRYFSEMTRHSHTDDYYSTSGIGLPKLRLQSAQSVNNQCEDASKYQTFDWLRCGSAISAHPSPTFCCF